MLIRPRFMMFMGPDDGAPGGGPAPTPPPDPGDPPKEPKFASQLPPEIKTKYAKELGDYADKGIGDLVSDLFTARGQLSRAIVIPDPKTGTDEEKATFRTRLGIPESPDKYEINIEAFKDLEGVEEVAKTLREKAYAKSFNQRQAQGFVEDVLGFVKTGNEATKSLRDEAKAKFDERLGDLIDPDKKLPPEQRKTKVTETANLMKAFYVKTLGDPELVKTFDEKGLFYDPRAAKRFAEIQQLLGDEKIIRSREKGGHEEKRGAMGSYSPGFNERYGNR